MKVDAPIQKNFNGGIKRRFSMPCCKGRHPFVQNQRAPGCAPPVSADHFHVVSHQGASDACAK
eukprot:6211196-Pleurochrysis_carterae.AAC.2